MTAEELYIYAKSIGKEKLPLLVIVGDILHEIESVSFVDKSEDYIFPANASPTAIDKQ